MSNAPNYIFEGTGEKIARYAHSFPTERFQLLPSSKAAPEKSFDQKAWDELIQVIESFRGKLPILSDDAASTDSLAD